MVAAETENKILKDALVLKEVLRYRGTPTSLNNCIKEIQKNFPKFQESASFYYFKEWKNRVNWRGRSGNSQGTPKELPRRAKGTLEKEKDIEKEKDVKNFSLNKSRCIYKPTGEPMRFSQGKWWVLPKNGGDWLEWKDKEETKICT